MLTLNDGRIELWQWDTGRKLTVDAECSQVHFSNKVFGRSIDVDVVDGVASIPDILLQTDKELTAWAFVGTAENGYTKISKVFKVNKRNKPADYVFTPTDQTTLGEILDRIEDLENRPSGDVSKEDIQDAVNDYLDKNPVSVEEKDPTVPNWAKQPNPPKQPNALPNPHKLTFTGAVTAEYDGSEAVEVEIPEGGGGIEVTGAEVGQTIVVKAVDENGKPTEWEAADFPEGSSGGGGATETLVASYTHSGNLEVVVSSIDYATGTITAVEHGLSENDMIYATQNWDVTKLENPEKWLPTGMLYGSKYYAVNVTTDTFQISTAKSGTAATLSTKGTADFSKWHFERDTDHYGSSIKLTNLGNLTNFAVRIFGKGLRNNPFYPNINAFGYGYFSTALDGFSEFMRFIGDGGGQSGDILFSVKSKVQYDKTLGRYFLDREGFRVINKNGSSYAVEKTSLDAHGVSEKTSPIEVTSMTFWNCYPANGTIVEVYKL